MARRQFPCGHHGKGQFCHRCQQEAATSAQHLEEVARQRAQREAWDQSFEADPIDLRGLPRERVEKARHVLRRLADGEPLAVVGGKRWESERTIVSVPVGRGFRLILRDHSGQLVPVACMTHEAYNHYKGLRR